GPSHNGPEISSLEKKRDAFPLEVKERLRGRALAHGDSKGLYTVHAKDEVEAEWLGVDYDRFNNSSTATSSLQAYDSHALAFQLLSVDCHKTDGPPRPPFATFDMSHAL
ncbi:hypothetical protein M513_14140, partial [Trichuris suis]